MTAKEKARELYPNSWYSACEIYKEEAERCGKISGFVAGADWMLEKAIYWLQEHVNDYLFDDGTPERPWLKCSACMFDAFKKAMEE